MGRFVKTEFPPLPVARAARMDSNEDDLASLASLAVATLDPDRCPVGLDPDGWRYAAKAARSLLADGWVSRALSLGWSELDLFGAGEVDPHADGLAVWLQGRTLRALCGTWAVAFDANGNRFYFNRPRSEGAVLLWKLDRGRR